MMVARTISPLISRGGQARHILVAAVFSALIIICVAIFIYRHQEEALLASFKPQLLSVAQDKAAKVVDWRNDKIIDAMMLLDSPFFVDAFKNWLADRSPVSTQKMADRLRIVQIHRNYSDVLLLDANEKIVFSLSGEAVQLDGVSAKALASAMSTRMPFLSELHLRGGDQEPGIDVVAPLVDRNGEQPVLLGAAVLRLDAAKTLYPLLDSWPVASASAETILVRREGERALFLNSPRSKPGLAMKHEARLDEACNPASLAVMGKVGVVEGPDWRGVAAFSAIRPVAGSPWFVVAKMDRAEAMAEWQALGRLIILLAACLLAGVAAIAGMAWQHSNRRRYQELFFQSENVIRDINDAVILADKNLLIIKANERAAQLYGYGREELEGMPISSLIAPEGLPDFQERILKAGKSALPILRQATHRRKNGEDFPVEISESVVDLDGERFFRAIVRDISQQVDAETALVESEQKFHSLVDAFPEAMLMASSPGMKVEFINRRFEEVTGYGKDDLPDIYRWWELAIPDPDARAEAVASWHGQLAAASVRQREIGPIEMMVSCKDGSQKCVLLKIAFLGDKVLAFVMDITARKNAEDAARQAEQQTRLILESVSEGIFGVDESGRVIFANTSAEDMLGWRAHELHGKNLHSIIHHTKANGEPYPERECPLAIACQLGVEVHRDHEMLWRKDKSSFPAELSARPIRKNSRIVGAVACFRDTSESARAREMQAQAEDRIRQAQKMDAIGQLASGVAHDFNNQLAAMIGYSEMLIASLREPKDKKFAERIHEAASNSANLVHQLLTFSRKGQVQYAPVDMHVVVGHVADMLSHSIDKRIKIEQRLNASPSGVMGDNSQLQNALLNLGLNARDAMPDGGTLSFSTDIAELGNEQCANIDHPICPGAYLRITVEDTGKGMALETRRRCLEPFFTTKDPGKGTGLGLAVVYGTVRQLNGTVSIQSELGSGTKISIYLPLCAAGKAQASDKYSIPNVKPLNIFFVDDEDLLLQLGKDLLGRMNHKVVTEQNGARAVELYAARWQEFDLVIMDMMMPEMNGRDAFLRMKEINPNIKALIVSGYNLINTAEELIRCGIQGVLAKPFTENELRAKLAGIFARGGIAERV